MPLEENETPQFALPFQFTTDGKEPRVVAEDSEEEIRSCVEVLLRTPLGFHEEEPELGGAPEPFEEGGPDIDEIQAAIAQWEPRADAIIEERPDFLDAMVSTIAVDVRVRQDG